MILVSIAIKSGIGAFIISDRGVVKYSNTYRIRDEKAKGNSYSAILDVIKNAVQNLRVYIEANPDTNEVVFESSNGHVLSWFSKGCKHEGYEDLFREVMFLLNEIPIRYSTQLRKKPHALEYASERYIKKPKLSGFDMDFFEGVDDNA